MGYTQAYLSFALFWTISSDYSQGLRIWRPNTNAYNIENWNLKRFPQNCDKIRFEQDFGLTALWDIQQLNLASLQFPLTGSVLFSDNIKIDFNNLENCRNNELVFTRSVKDWLDPDNWNGFDWWRPHVERKPCSGETIVFPENSAFGINLPNITLPVERILFMGKEYNARSWTKFLQTETGNEYFKGPDTLRTTIWRSGGSCENQQVCFCSDDAYSMLNGVYDAVSPGALQDAVCKYFRNKKSDESVECVSPVVPVGHCWGICGAVIKVQLPSNDDSELMTAYKQISQMSNREAPDDIQWHISKIQKDEFQVVFLGKTKDGTSSSIEFAKQIQQSLLSLNPPVAAVLEYSGPLLSRSWAQEPPSIFFGMFFIIMLLFGGVFYVYVIHPKKKLKNLVDLKPFSFARFENTIHESSSEEHLEIGAEPDETKSMPASKSFENPMFEEGPSGSNTGKFETVACGEVLPDSDTEPSNDAIYSQLEMEEKDAGGKEIVESVNPLAETLVFDEVKF